MYGVVSKQKHPEAYTLQIQLYRLLRDHFPEPRNLKETLDLRATDAPDLEAVRKWYYRGSLPGKWLAWILLLVEERGGEPLSLITYLGVGNEKCSRLKGKPSTTGKSHGVFG